MTSTDPESTFAESRDPLDETVDGLPGADEGDGLREGASILRPVVSPKIEGYELHEMIGRGSAGAVFRATQLAVEREVAIKVLHAELSGKPRVVRRMQREARTMARLGHPNVVSAIDMGQAQGRWWFAMEYVDGPSLLDRLRVEGRISEREALRLFTEVAEALEHLAAHGVVHRDVKPANILLSTGGRDTGRGRAVLADLGLAFAETDASLTRQGGGTLGTPHYISPEQARDASVVDVRADIWGFGATLFHALCGRPPFRSNSVAEVLSAVLHGLVPNPRGLVPELSTGIVLVLRKCLAREPEHRYQTPRELLDDLDRLRERRAPHVRRAELDPLERSGRRVPGWMLGAGLGLTLGAGVTILGVLWSGDPDAGPVGMEGEGLAANPLEDVLQLARIDSAQLGDAFLAVEELRVVGNVQVAAWTAKQELEKLTRVQLASVAQDLSAELDERLADGDYAGAQRLATEEFDARLKDRTGMARADLEQVLGGASALSLGQPAARVASAAARALEQTRGTLERRFEQIELRQVDRLAEQRRYASALAGLDAALDSALAAVGIDAERWLEADLAALRSSQAAEIQRRRASLRTAWTGAQRALQDRLGARARGFAEQLDWTARRADLAKLLEGAMESELAEFRIELHELTATGEQLVREALARRQRELETAFDERVPALVGAAFELRAELLAPELYRTRRAGRVLELFDLFEEEASPAGLAAAIGVPGGLRLELEEARRLDDLHRLVVAGLRRAARERTPVEMEPLTGVRLGGRIDAGPDPEQDGFRFVGNDHETYQLRLSRLPLDDYLRLAELGAGAQALDPLDRALLRLREGEGVPSELAAEAARPVPGDSGLELRGRLLLRVVEARSEVLASRGARALQLLQRLGRAPGERLEEYDPAGALIGLELLLGELGAEQVEVNFTRAVLRDRLARLED